MFLKGLEGVIGLSVTHPTWQKTKPAVDNHAGWTFAKPGTAFSSPAGHGSFAFPDTDEDPINAKQNIREIYEEADPNFQGRYTVPILWDRRKGTIVNNESMDLIRIFNREFNTLAERPDVDLRPTDLEETIDSVHPWLYNGSLHLKKRFAFLLPFPFIHCLLASRRHQQWRLQVPHARLKHCLLVQRIGEKGRKCSAASVSKRRGAQVRVRKGAGGV